MGRCRLGEVIDAADQQVKLARRRQRRERFECFPGPIARIAPGEPHFELLSGPAGDRDHPYAA